jgi:hypothetical protein
MKRSVIATFLLASPFILGTAQTPLRSSAPVDLKSVVIRLERTQCFGSCPIYSVVITGDGLVTYNGKAFVAVKGQRIFRIQREKVRALVEAFIRMDYLSLQEKYDHVVREDGLLEYATDLPTTITSFRLKGRSKKVSNYYGGPAALSELEDKIDETAGIASFIEVHAKKPE